MRFFYHFRKKRENLRAGSLFSLKAKSEKSVDRLA